MILIDNYKRPSVLFNGHLETIFPTLFRKVKFNYLHEFQKLTTLDDDFLDLYWIRGEGEKLAILQHGLEGSWDRSYMLGMASTLIQNGYDVCLWNYRGCGREMNKMPIFYHSGATYDLDAVVNEAKKRYDDITLIGFSLGANMTLKYVGERTVIPQIKKAVAISVPLDLESGSSNLHAMKNRIYELRFLKSLKKKILLKHRLMPGKMPIESLTKVKSIWDFDEYFTAPLHGFENAKDYYNKNSSRFFLDTIKIPTLILNAKNDPLLTHFSFNQALTSNNNCISHHVTAQGGHVGYTSFKNNLYWSEQQVINFCEKHA